MWLDVDVSGNFGFISIEFWERIQLITLILFTNRTEPHTEWMSSFDDSTRTHSSPIKNLCKRMRWNDEKERRFTRRMCSKEYHTKLIIQTIRVCVNACLLLNSYRIELKWNEKNNIAVYSAIVLSLSHVLCCSCLLESSGREIYESIRNTHLTFYDGFFFFFAFAYSWYQNLSASRVNRCLFEENKIYRNKQIKKPH